MRVFELTRNLIEIESITGNEKNLALFIHTYLSQLKYHTSLQEVAPGRFNVIAHTGKPELFFSTHMDTVPPYLPFREDDEFIYGRGACDAKGILAAQIEAAERLRANGEDRIGLLFVAGEEHNSVGSRAATPPASIRFLINGEPTQNQLVIGSKGLLRAEIITRGKASHSGYPKRGESAILKLLDLLQELRGLEMVSDPLLGETTCNIGIIEGGTKANIVPDRARAEILFRCAEPVENLRTRIETLIGQRAELQNLFEVPIVRLNTVEGFAATVVSFTSDVAFLNQWGKPYMVGPGSILDAHTMNERIAKRELLAGVDLYVRLASHLLQ